MKAGDDEDSEFDVKKKSDELSLLKKSEADEKER